MQIKQDQLNRQPFIDLLRSVIENQISNESGYSIALNGEWGCGKTWILSELEKQLDNNYLIFHYNAWENNYYEEPLVAILSIFLNSLDKFKNVEKEDSGEKIISNSFTTLFKVVGTVIEKKYGINPSELLEAVKNTADSIIDSKLSENDFNILLPLKNALTKIKEVLTDLSAKYNLILIVDELDRCLPEYAVKVLERLHHICSGIKIIQIIAIDKSHLADGIAKVYGKGFSYNNGIKNPYVLQFADNYLQKFVDISIPVPNGTPDKDKSILNGLEDLFEPYVRDNNYGTVLVCFDEAFLLSFITTLFQEIDKRTQEKITNRVKLCHELTIATGNSMEQYCYQHLIIEILLCIQVCYFNSKTPITLEDEKEYNGGKVSLKFFKTTTSPLSPYMEKYKQFNVNLSKITTTKTDGSDLNKNFAISNTLTYLYRFFCRTEERSYDYLQNMFITDIEDDWNFLNSFAEMLWKLNS